ncbi:MAG: trypsin-like peptidase domain-containing protein [Halobacteriovoraceae bacterium]|jgi:V8-like Glu-specific endopeptidase|nr:trypsin-like peptidase domain-containing protein [Candidatus Falkowbacteria bacterium]MBT4793150.1 trypsin-like peptidase domain-containing protein [Halobacteriovoraceae bacterium]
MRKCLLLLVGLACTQAYSETRIVYGQDNRVDLKNVRNQKIQELSKSIAGRISNYSYSTGSKNGHIAFEDILKLSDPNSMNVCSDQKFSNQPTVADCTGFLIADNILVTAGHCMTEMGIVVKNESSRGCLNNSWLFDYKVDSGGEIDLNNVKQSNIYGCKNVIYAKYEPMDDFAIIELDRKVVGRRPLKLNKSKAPRKNTKIFVMGHPSGLPMKYADGAKIFDVKNAYFSTNLDTFGGNSGSPVFNAKTLMVEGILVRGDVDYYESRNVAGDTCMKVNVCSAQRSNCIEDDPGIEGEHVSLIARVLQNLL